MQLPLSAFSQYPLVSHVPVARGKETRTAPEGGIFFRLLCFAFGTRLPIGGYLASRSKGRWAHKEGYEVEIYDWLVT
jgi:hypothetical protein